MNSLDLDINEYRQLLNKTNELVLKQYVELTLSNLSILKTGKAKAIRFSTLDAICKALDCQPGDILEYRKEEKSTTSYQQVEEPS